MLNRTMIKHMSNTPNDRNLKRTSKHHGVTAAISLAKPEHEDIMKTDHLSDALSYFECQKTVESDVINRLGELFKKWVNDFSTGRNMPEAAAANLGGRIQSFGAFRLGVHHKGTVIDALCLAPRNIQRSAYFSSFFELLKQQPEVTKCRSVEEAFDPVIKMRFNGIRVDLFFARLALSEIPNDLDLCDDEVLKNLDLVSMRSMNGCRTTEKILTLVPNLETFRLALRTVLLWARNNGICSHTLGFFDGVTWAMLVARTCQLFPNAAAATIVHKFFFVFSNWQWPRPVLLDHPENINLVIEGLMPVIKPTYPEQDLASNVCASTKKVILAELWRGMVITDKIMAGQVPWEHLFDEQIFFDFSNRYPSCIMILVHSLTADDHLVWNDLVESKIRVLVGTLERNSHITLAHPSAKTFSYQKSPANDDGDDDEEVWSQDAPSLFPSPYCTMWFVGLDFVHATYNLNIDLTKDIKTFTDHVLQHGSHTNLLKEGMTIEANQVKL